LRSKRWGTNIYHSSITERIMPTEESNRMRIVLELTSTGEARINLMHKNDESESGYSPF